MTSIRRTRRFDRRRATRRSHRIRALVGPKNTSKDQYENAVVQEIAKGGVKIVSGAPLNPDDSCVIYIDDRPQPLRAKVVWVRKEGLIEKRRTGKPGQAFVAGCHLKKENPKLDPAAKPRGAARHASKRADTVMRAVLRSLIIAGGLGVLGLMAYAVVSLLSMAK